MKLTNDEITVLTNYYYGLEFDEKAHVDDLKQTCTDLLDEDLFATQLKRYEHRIDGYESRVRELQSELDTVKL